MIQLLPSLLAADFTRLGEQIELIEEAGIQVLHLDVMDGHFVPNLSFGPDLIKALRSKTDMIFDVHLMVEKPENYIDMFKAAGADYLSVQIESTPHVHRALQMIKAAGMKAGVVLNPQTPATMLEQLMDDVDLILVMSVNPGFGGQSYIPQSTSKLEQIRKMIHSSGRDIRLSVDGGIKLGNVETVLKAGADWIVAGSDVFGAEDIEERIQAYQKVFYHFEVKS